MSDDAWEICNLWVRQNIFNSESHSKVNSLIVNSYVYNQKPQKEDRIQSLGDHVLKSFGPVDTIASFFTTKNVLILQALNKWTYTKAISRVQTKLNIFQISVFFLRRDQPIIDEIKVPSLEHVEKA